MITGSASTMNVSAQTQTLPTCTDPTGNNLPCMMVISTLPPPVNAIHCQESSGLILACSYATQTLSNGDQIVVITVYVPESFIFSPGNVKVVVHGSTVTKIFREEPRGVRTDEPTPICKGIQGIHGCIVFLPGGPGQQPFPIYLTPLPTGPHTAGFRLGWFDGNEGNDFYDIYPVGSKDWLAYELGYDQGLAKSTPYTNCEHFDTCPDPKYDPTKDPRYSPQSFPTPCISPQDIDYCSKLTTNPLGLLVPSNGNSSQAEEVVNNSSPRTALLSGTNVSSAVAGGKGVHPTSCFNNCTSTSPTQKVNCSTNPSTTACHAPQQHHTAAYLQALNSGSPNPFKPGTKDYEHYQAGLDGRQQNNGGSSSGGSGSSSSSGGSDNSSPGG